MDKNRNISGIIIGTVLILVGIFAFLGRFFVFADMGILWPLIVVAVGAAFFAAMVLGGKSLGGLAVPGSILVVIGLILFFMNLTNTWEAWSYCWALIVFASGLGVWINGLWSGNPELRQRGFATVRTGLLLFIIFGVIMEFIFSLSGQAHWGTLILWAILVSLVGLYLLITNIIKVVKPGGGRSDLFWPVILIGIGLVAIFAELNWITVDNLARMANLWPVLLIVAGIGVIFRHSTPWIGAILGVILIAGVLVIGFAGTQLGLASGFDWINNIGTIQFGNVTGETVTGSGHIISETRQVSGVSRVELSIDANLEIKQGAAESIIVTADDNILPILQTNVVAGTMNIRYQSLTNVRGFHQPKLVLTVKNLNGLRLSSSGTVTVAPLTTGNFNIDLTSSCNLNIQNIQADKITTNISSSGDIDIQGVANSLDLHVSSSGNFNAGNLQVQTASVTLSSSGDITLWVIKNLSVNISSSGDVMYYGSPTVNQHISSSGQVISKGNK